MPRNQQPGTTLRNRNRVTNKTRLKIIRGTIDGDPLVIDEEEERARVIATSGVDAEDANEHHLQVAINAAAQRHSTFGNDAHDKGDRKKDAYIPTPDATGLAAHFTKLYPADQWTRSHTYLKFSDTVEDTVSHALSNAYSYFMDKRDNDWLEKNNQDAKGEGTSAQSGVGTTTRASRNSKSKGKEPEVPQPLSMTEDEFELIMGLLERITDDRHPCLHVDTTQIPAFSEFEPIFSSDLPVSYFSSYVLPPTAPPPSRAVQLARLIYPHWRERRLECGGRRIIAQLNDDETNDNDPYVCFRRRDSKPVRKTRASQSAITDRLLKLKSELGQAHTLATELLRREEAKRTALQTAQAVVTARTKLAEIKRRQGQPPSKDEEEMLFDKERTIKKQRTLDRVSASASGIKTRNLDSPMPGSEARMWPKDRYQKIQSEINDELAKLRDRSSSWEDIAEHPLQYPCLSSAEKMFSVIALDDTDDGSTPMDVDQVNPREPRFLRLRSGRGGRLHVDRTSRFNRLPLSEIHDDADRAHRLSERWKYDCDSVTRNELDDRFFVDDYDPRYLRHSVKLLTSEDRDYLSIDIPVPPSQPLIDPSRSIVARLAQRRGVDDMGRIVAPPRLSPPPSTSATPAPLANPNQIRAQPAPVRLTGTSSGAPPNYLAQAKTLLDQTASSSQVEDAAKIDVAGLAARVGVSTTTPHMAMTDNGTFNTPAIARQHRSQAQPGLPAHATLVNGAMTNGYGALNGSPQMGGDLTPQQVMQLRQAYANAAQPTNPQTVAYQSMSPPMRPQSRLQSMVGVTPTGPADAANLGANHMNLRHPGKIPRRASPQINGDMMPNHSPMISSPLVPHNASPLLRAASANGNHLSPPHAANLPSPINYGGMTASPQMHSLGHPSAVGGIAGSPIMHPPSRPPSAIPHPSHHTSHINGLGQTSSF